MGYLLALDQGTTSSRAIVFDGHARVVAQAQRPFPQHFPQPGWVEHDPEDLWSSQVGVAAEALSRSGIAAKDIRGIGITNQRETTLLWDRRTGVPLHRAIVWQDRRTAPLCDALREAGLGPLFRERTGLVLDSYFSGTKLRWLLDHIPHARSLAHAGHLAFGTVDTWLAWKLSGGSLHVTDVSNASRTLLFNLHTGAWDDELCAALDVPHSVLPEIRPSSHVFGYTSEALLPARIPIAGIAGDQQAATFGQRCIAPGMVKNTYGTGCFLLMHTGSTPVPSRHDLLTTVAWQLEGRPMEYALEGSVFMAGALVQWLRDGLQMIRTSEEIEDLARTVPDSGGVFLVPAFTGLGAPYWDPDARGLLIGMTRGTQRGHIARAALDGIALQVADVVVAMEADAPFTVRELRVDGGASRNRLLMQLQADLLGVPLLRPTQIEATALGAAYLAGLATGVWASPDDLPAPDGGIEHFYPALAPEARKHLVSRWHRAVERSRHWAADV